MKNDPDFKSPPDYVALALLTGIAIFLIILIHMLTSEEEYSILPLPIQYTQEIFQANNRIEVTYEFSI